VVSVPAVTDEELRAAVAAVPDPELPVLTLDDLGVVREVRLEGGRARVRITPTYLACPALGAIKDDVRAAAAALGVPADVEVVLSPPWHPGLISERGRARLAEAGIAPPHDGGSVELGMPGPPGARCPRCGGGSRLLSARGPTPCTSLHVCDSCGEPFEKVRER
jgi:ring-1,2-phenylacetyl-CoA epoxidase subunit PaaD